MYNNNELVKTLRNPQEMVDAVMDFLKKAGTKRAGANLDFSKTFADMVRWHTIDVANGGAGVKEFFQGTFNANDTNMRNAFISPQSEHMVVTGLRIESAVGSDLDNLDFEPGLPTGANGAAMKSAVINIVNNNEVALSQYPLNEALTGLTTRDQGFIKLHAPIPWLGNTDIKVNVNFPTAPVEDQAMRVKLVGIGFTS